MIVAPTDEMIAQAVRILHSDGVVAFPTETVYGLGGDTFNVAALTSIYELKGRPANNPLIAHVFDWSQVYPLVDFKYASESVVLEQSIADLTSRFWPGPLTIVLPKAERVPSLATAGLPTIAVRSPAHPVARRLLQAFGLSISAPSANRSGHVSPTTAQHVASDFVEHDLLILDGGTCDLGIESTVLDLTAAGPPRVLRYGSVTLEQLREALGDVDSPTIQSQAASPGTTSQHYAPRTPAELVETDALSIRLRNSIAPCAVLTFTTIAVPAPHRAVSMPREAAAYAQQLYAALRAADAMSCGKILIETPPSDNDLWRAIRDRLRRATTR